MIDNIAILLGSPAAASSLVVLFASVLVTFILQTITGNWSWVDRWWSIAPGIYTTISAVQSPSPRTFIMAALVDLWCLRLSYNFFRRGGFNPKEEDYRWAFVRKFPIMINNKLTQTLFSFGFVSLFQNLLLLAFSSPSLLAASNLIPQTNRDTLGLLDYIAATTFFLALVGEAIFDKQQYNYQEAKWAAIKAKQALTPEQKQGFKSTGAWKYSRHPNYFCEMAMWCAFHLFGISATGLMLNITLLGPLVLIFVISTATNLSESLTSGKYEKYKIYMESVSRFIPFLPHSNPRLCGGNAKKGN